jgi:ABC-2 type transport system permease protein
MAINLFVAAFIIIGVFMFTCLGILAGSVAKTEEGASVVGNIITFPMMFLAGTFFPISIMPSWLQTVAHVLPLYYIIDGLNSVTTYTNYASAWLDLAVSVAVALVIFALSIWKFDWKEE